MKTDSKMANVSLFKLSQEQLELIELIEESEGVLDEVTEAALTINQERYVEKAGNYLAVLESIEFDLERAKQAKAQIEKFVKAKTRVMEELESRLTQAVKLFGPAEVGFKKISLRKSEGVVIGDESLVPETFITEKVVRTVDKTKIKNAIKNGDEVPGAFIEMRQNLQIR